MNQNILKISLVLIVLVAIGAFFFFDLHHHLSLKNIKLQQEAWIEYYSENKLITLSVFFLVYVLVTALSLPAAAILTLLAGMLFGFINGLIVVSFASTIGATLAFWMARFILKDSVQEKFGNYLKKINDGFEKEGAFYLFALRLVPILPFFAVNLMMGLLPIKTITYYWVSQLGMLAGTAVYVYAGTELGKISSLSDIASPTLIAAFIALGLLPLASKTALKLLRKGNVDG